MLELYRYIGNTHYRGRLWDNRNHRQMMTIGDQSMPMFYDDVTHRIHLAMGSIGHQCSTIQGSTRYLSLMTVQALREVSVFDQAVLLLIEEQLDQRQVITLLDQQSSSKIERGNKSL